MMSLVQQLQQDGVVRLPGLLTASQLQAMQTAFAARLRYPSFNTWRGFEQNERWRRLVEDCLELDRGFVEAALHPRVHEILQAYLDADYVLTEARGWETIATRRNFHGWHNDAWYDTDLTEIPRQVKLGVYLSPAHSGHFRYLAGSHRLGLRPTHWNDAQVETMARETDRAIVDVQGEAGDAFLFDTCGVHRQAAPVLQPRWVVFFNFHDPSTALMAGETAYGRYQPPRLNVATLPRLSPIQQQRLGIGRQLQPKHVGSMARRRFPLLHAMVAKMLALRLRLRDVQDQHARLVQAIQRRLR